MTHADAPQLRHTPATVHGRWLYRPAPSPGPSDWLVGFHGQAETAAAHLGILDRLELDGQWLRCAVQGLNRHYTGRAQVPVATWMTREDRDLAIADNLRWVDAVLDQLESEVGAPRRIVYAGFSQGVAMAWRAARRGARPCHGVIACCAGLPPELREPGGRPWPPALMAAGQEDGWYDAGRLAEDADFVAGWAPVATRVLPGGHAWGPEMDALAAAWLTGLSAQDL
jgi:predicted esterase